MFSMEKKENAEILLRQKSWREMRGRVRFRERRCQRSDEECRSTSEQKPELKTDNVAWLRGEGRCGWWGVGPEGRVCRGGCTRYTQISGCTAIVLWQSSLRLDTGLWWVSPLHFCQHHSSGLTVSSHTQPKYVLLKSQYRCLLKFLIIYQLTISIFVNFLNVVNYWLNINKIMLYFYLFRLLSLCQF